MLGVRDCLLNVRRCVHQNILAMRRHERAGVSIKPTKTILTMNTWWSTSPVVADKKWHHKGPPSNQEGQETREVWAPAGSPAHCRRDHSVRRESGYPPRLIPAPFHVPRKGRSAAREPLEQPAAPFLRPRHSSAASKSGLNQLLSRSTPKLEQARE
jgi:hypothetical protein